MAFLSVDEASNRMTQSNCASVVWSSHRFLSGNVCCVVSLFLRDWSFSSKSDVAEQVC